MSLAVRLRCAMLATAICLLAACQHPPGAASASQPPPVPVGGIGYVVFNAPIAVQSRDLFIADVEQLRAAGATQIAIGMNSPGGDIDAARGIVDYMRGAHEQFGTVFRAYDIGLVASAATFVFLNAQERYAVQQGAFVFHAAGLVASGPVSAENLRESADKLDAYEGLMRATLRARTRLTDDEALTYVRRTVLLNSDDARRDGIIDAVAPFVTPRDARSWIITAKPVRPPGSPG